MIEAIDIHTSDDPDMLEARVGEVLNIKGRLDSVRYGDNGAGRGRDSDLYAGPPTHTDPSLVIHFADWSTLAITLRDYATAKGIRIPLSTYVCVKAQKIHEDGDLMALAIWELGGGAVIPLGEMMV